MARFFQSFPKIPYDMSNERLKTFDRVTNVFFRLRVLRSVLTNISAYYEYIIREGDTPEILANKVYGDAEAHWIILMANDIIDAQYDWPLNNRDFKKYILAKYGTLENAKTTYHHYEKVIQRTESLSGLVTERRFEVNETKLAKNVSSVIESLPYDYYEAPTNPEQYMNYGTVLPDTQSYLTIDVGLASKNSTSTLVDAGRTITEVISREAVSNYDYEVAENEKKRTIKIIKPEYYPQIMKEFSVLTETEKPSYVRRLSIR